jgi:hypothetical protein
MATTAPADTPRTKVEDKNFFHLTLIIIFGIFATTLPQPQVLGRLPLQFLLKDQLHADPEKVSFFFLACGLAWYVKPLAGILTDAFPLFGTRRRNYMLASSVLAAVSWIGMFLAWRASPTYGVLLGGAIIVNLFMVMASTVTGAFLVEAGQSFGATGRLTSVRMFVQNVCGTINGYAGGLLASVGFLWAAGVNAALILTLFPITYIFLREKKVRQGNAQAFENAGKQLKTIGKSSTLWWGLGFIFLFYFAPGFATLQFFRQTNELHFNAKFIGLLGSIGGVAGLIAAVAYAYMIKKLSLRTMIFIGVATAGLGTLFYLPMFYRNSTSAMPVDFQNGLFFTLAEIALMDLAARATPVGCEGLGYGLILSIRNVAIFGADYLGSWFSEKQHIPFTTMVVLNSATTLVVLILLPFLPAAIMKTKDKARTSEPDPELRPAEDDI